MAQSPHLLFRIFNIKNFLILDNFNKTINVELYEIIPYADKAQIIQAIQFLENINSVIK